MTRYLRNLGAPILAAVLALGCNKGAEAGAGQAEQPEKRGEPCDNWISGQAAREIVSSGGLLLDVRSSAEFDSGHLEGATNINVDDLSERMAELPKDRHVVVYCRSGKRAHRAAQMLTESGYEVSELGTQAQYSADSTAGCAN